LIWKLFWNLVFIFDFDSWTKLMVLYLSLVLRIVYGQGSKFRAGVQILCRDPNSYAGVQILRVFFL